MLLIVRVTPRAGRDALAAGPPEHLAARVAAAPVDGGANRAVCALVAAALGIAKGAVTVVGGETARIKRLHVRGDAAALARAAAALYGSRP